MSTTYGHGLGVCCAGLALALGGCAMLEDGGETTSAAPARSATTAMGATISPFMRAGLQPFSVANCVKFEALPPECERVVKRGE